MGVEWIAGLAAAGLLAAALGVAGYFVLLTRSIAAEAERHVPPAGAFLDIDGQRIHYVEKGAGRPILFIHGLGAQLHHFVGPLFGAFGDGWRLVAIDRPGSGYSTRASRSDGRLAGQALAVRHVIEALGLSRPLVVGHSLGGAVALKLALDHPDAISGLALISPHTDNTGGVPPEFSALNIRSRLKRRLLAETVAVPRARKDAAAVLSYVFGPQQPGADYMVAGGGWLGLRPSHVYASATDAVALDADRETLHGRFGEISMPVGILFGTADRVLDYQKHGVEMVGRIADLDLELLDGVGHLPQFVEPERTAAFIERIAARAFASR